MASQEEILSQIINNGGAISTTELRKIYGIKKGNGLGHLSQRLRQLMKKKIISKVRGLNREVIYFLIDISTLYTDEDRRKYSPSKIKE
ncbi:hypothetical protein KKP97_05290 [Methanothermococcus sp. SCGC AD-155-C09]|nr:hypothetical protein [Methanothermococcus sp. SCGC AD-155-C09]